MNHLNKMFKIFILYCIFIFKVSFYNIIVFSLKKVTDLIIKKSLNSPNEPFASIRHPPTAILARKNGSNCQN